MAREGASGLQKVSMRFEFSNPATGGSNVISADWEDTPDIVGVVQSELILPAITELVRRSRAAGKVKVRARVTDDIMPGVVCLLEGVWPKINADWVEEAGSVNILTSTIPTMPSEASRTHSVNIKIYIS